MKRRIIKIDEDKCNGCTLCAKACHEGAIGMVDGKAKLLRDDYCDGLGDCLPVCPTGAISFEEREALEYDEQAVMANMIKNHQHGHSCPGSMARTINEKPQVNTPINAVDNKSQLMQWPVQIKLVPVNAPYFHNANLLVAADCSAFAYGNFHQEFIKNHVVIIGCPKLDMEDYAEKLTEIIRNNEIKSLSIVRMEVPCCGGLEYAAKQALQASGKFIPWQVYTISIDGEIID